jgi:hypothetical protein
LDPRTCDIEYFNMNIQLNDIGKLKALSILENALRKPLFRKFGWKIVRTVDSLQRTPEYIERIEHIRDHISQLISSNTIIYRKLFNHQELNDIVLSEDDLSMLHRILTLLLFIEEVDRWNNHSQN